MMEWEQSKSGPADGAFELMDEMLAELLAAEPEVAGPPLMEPASMPSSQPPLETLMRAMDARLRNSPHWEWIPQVRRVETHAEPARADGGEDHIIFRLSDSEYAIPLLDVAEAGRAGEITRLPNAPSFVSGVTNLRGEVVPIFNLQKMLGLEEEAAELGGRVLYLRPRNSLPGAGLVVNALKGIRRIPAQQLEHANHDAARGGPLRGVFGRGERRLHVLDTDGLYAMEEFRMLQNPGEEN
ncbi:MAG: purine-binding chemotaxis protein CheW [Candidatus Solibacter usitatus]|nr:purine-binding chemotaxis protein CheW [Candidatus Solibacter usitatus]